MVSPKGSERFESLVRPLTIPSIPCHRATASDAYQIQLFLEQFFGTPPTTPTLQVALDPSNEIILIVHENKQLVASIRYKYAGKFEGQPIHIIDCFCIHPSKRKSGLATKLLATLHTYTMGQGLRYSLFLKEGRALPNHEPLYSSTYVFRQSLQSRGLKGALSPQRAAALVAAYRTLNPETLWLHDVRNTNQQWFFWKSGLDWILLCVQNAWQEWKGGRIGWVTACFASEPIRAEPFEALIDAANYEWIWMDQVWVPESTTRLWLGDGPFHWYAYQWSTNLGGQRFYGLVV